jgi:hypothetical protein
MKKATKNLKKYEEKEEHKTRKIRKSIWKDEKRSTTHK